MADAFYVVDTSVLARETVPAVRDRLRPLIESGLLAIAATTRLELGYSARSATDWSTTRCRLGAFAALDVTAGDMRRAAEVQDLLIARGQHRGPGVAGLLLAAAAERADLCVLHTTGTSRPSPRSPNSERRGWFRPDRWRRRR